MQLGSGAFTDLTNFSFSSSASSGASLGPVDLSGYSVLQNIPSGTTVTFRLAGYGATGSGGTWYIYDSANSAALDFAVSGSISYPPPAVTLTPIQLWRQQWFGTTNNSGAAADTNVASSDGMPNLLKYALGLNPLTAATNPITGDITTGFLRLKVPRNPTATDITYLIESVGDLTAAWNTNAILIDSNAPALLAGFVAAFVGYEGTLYLAHFALGGGVEAYAPAVIIEVLRINALAFVGLLAAWRIGAAIGFAPALEPTPEAA